MSAGHAIVGASVEPSAIAMARRPHLDTLFAQLKSLALSLAGFGILLGAWWIGGWLVASNPATSAFADFAPGPTLRRLSEMISAGDVWSISQPSLVRVGLGLVWATAFAIPLGILIGRSTPARTLTNLPFQFLRMISPLSWMPVAILAFSTWDSAIVFLIAVAAVWPILFSTAAGVRRIDPIWFKVAWNLGAKPLHILTTVIFPAIAQDILGGIRLALGVAWIVLVPAEYLGVKSGLGYAINDARDTLEYDRLFATVLIIGAIGFLLDVVLQQFIRRVNWIRQD